MKLTIRAMPTIISIFRFRPLSAHQSLYTHSSKSSTNIECTSKVLSAVNHLSYMNEEEGVEKIEIEIHYKILREA